MSAYGWMQADARRRELDRVNADGRADRARIAELESKLADAQRNEERAVAEVAEVQSLVLKLESDVVGLKVELSGLQHRAKRELATAVHEAGCDRVRFGASRVRLNTLEAAVRAVRGSLSAAEQRDDLGKLYALVPDGSEGGS